MMRKTKKLYNAFKKTDNEISKMFMFINRKFNWPVKKFELSMILS